MELARRLAASLGSRPQWFWDGEEQHMHAHRRFELDLVVGGLDDRDPWKKKVGITRPYFAERILVGVRPASHVPASLKGLTVAAKAGGEVTGLLREKNANPGDGRPARRSGQRGGRSRERDLLLHLEEARNVANSFEWRLHDVNIVPVRRF